MQHYFAPMEGLTDSVYRRLHHTYFGGVDRYYMPFISPTMHRTLTHREERDLPLADAADFCAIPQVLTKNAGDFLWAAQVCRDRGYTQINLNLGCPSGTVVAKGKGAGMLRDPGELDAFFSEIFAATPLPVSVKTRLGLTESGEFPAILEVLNRYPITELTVHPRVRKQFYDGVVDMEMFRYAAENSEIPLCFNGDLRSLEDISVFSADFPKIGAVMLGRGLLADPGMFSGGTKKEDLRGFMEELLGEYMALFGGPRNAMFRLKEHWGMILGARPGTEKLLKRLRKTTDVEQYKASTQEIFDRL